MSSGNIVKNALEEHPVIINNPESVYFTRSDVKLSLVLSGYFCLYVSNVAFMDVE